MVEKDTLWVSQPRCVDNPPPARPIDTTIIVPLISALMGGSQNPLLPNIFTQARGGFGNHPMSSALTIYIGDQPRPWRNALSRK